MKEKTIITSDSDSPEKFKFPSSPCCEKIPSPGEGINDIEASQDNIDNSLTRHLPDNQNITAIRLNTFFSAMHLPPAAAKSYAKAFSSLISWTSGHSSADNPLTTTLLADWLITLFLGGRTLSTLNLYLNAISAVYSVYNLQVREGNIADEDGGVKPDFRFLRQQLSLIAKELKEHESTRSKGSRKSVKEEAQKVNPESKEEIPKDLIEALWQVALYEGGLTLKQALMLRKDDLPALHPASQIIVSRYHNPRRSFLFPLNQSTATAAAIALKISRSAGRMASPGQIWFETALKIGATPSEAISTLGRIPFLDPAKRRIFSLLGQPDTAFFRKGNLGEENKGKENEVGVNQGGLNDSASVDSDPRSAILRESVNEVLTRNPLRWYALHLRRGTSPDTLRNRLEELRAKGETDVPAMPEYFYPREKIIERIGKRLIRNERAILPEIMFVRLRATEILSLLRHIGDMAWCYKSASGMADTTVGQEKETTSISGRTVSVYASIPDAEMKAFQLAIGVFTPKTDIYPIGSFEPTPGQPLLIIGGELKGRVARYIGNRPANDPSMKDTTVLYRLILPGENGIEWTADLDPRLLTLT